MKLIVASLGIALLTAGSATGDERLAIRVSPSIAFAPANLVVRTQVTANSANRTIEVIAESPEFYRSSEMQLDGDRAPRTSIFEFRSLPVGTYVVRAVLKGTRGDQLAVQQTAVRIVDSETAGR
jgi:hypothetical protein